METDNAYRIGSKARKQHRMKKILMRTEAFDAAYDFLCLHAASSLLLRLTNWAKMINNMKIRMDMADEYP